MDKHLMASVYEIRGEREKAVAIYRDILKENPSDKIAEKNLRRSRKIDTSAVDKYMLNLFTNAQNGDEIYEFERWLVGN